MLNYLKKRYLPFNFNMLMENIQKCIFFLIFHLAHFFCSRVYIAHYATHIQHTIPHIYSTLYHTYIAHYTTHIQHTIPHIYSTLYHTYIAHYTTHIWHTIPHIYSTLYHTYIAHYTTHIQHTIPHIYIPAHDPLYLHRCSIPVCSSLPIHPTEPFYFSDILRQFTQPSMCLCK